MRGVHRGMTRWVANAGTALWTPYRLLDWSANALVGLYFAVQPDAPGNQDVEDGCLWALHPPRFNREMTKSDRLAFTGRSV